MSQKVKYKQAKRDRSRIAKERLAAARQAKQHEFRVERQTVEQAKKAELLQAKAEEAKKARDAIPTDVLSKWYVQNGLIFGNTYLEAKGYFVTQEFDKSEFDKTTQTVQKGKAKWKVLCEEQDKSLGKKNYEALDNLKLRDIF